eukprot:Platyproteum_vivax@DN5505_c0_g2_i1.p1
MAKVQTFPTEMVEKSNKAIDEASTTSSSCAGTPSQTGKEKDNEKAKVKWDVSRSILYVNERTNLDRDTLFSIYLQNCFLIPPSATYNTVFWNCTKQEDRCALVTEYAKLHDLVFLQEVFGPGLRHLNRQTVKTHELLPSMSGFTDTGSSFWDFYKLWMKSTGGLWCGCDRRTFEFKATRQRGFNKTVPFSNQSVILNELVPAGHLLAHLWPPPRGRVRLLASNTHFSTISAEHRDENLVSFRFSWIRSLMKELACLDWDLKKMAVNTWGLAAGDFNIDRECDPEEYRNLLNLRLG